MPVKRPAIPKGAPRPRRAVLDMAPYSPPTGGRLGKLRLDFNENTVGCSPKIIEFLKSQLSAEHLAVYPDYATLRPALATFFRVEPEQLLPTNGTDEAIQVLINTYIDDGDDVLLLHPSYAMYRFYAEVAGAAIREIDYRPGTLDFPLEELLDAITPETKAVLIANPNNPTGTGVALAGIEKILKRARKAAVLIDEAYYEFCGITALGLIADYPNLFVSRTFSKVYGMAAMRMGCLFSQAGQRRVPAQSAVALQRERARRARGAGGRARHRLRRNYVTEALAARELLCVGLEKLGIEYIPSQANFVLMRIGKRAIEIRDRLREMQVLVRDRSYEIAGCVRVTVGTREQTRRFLDALQEIW